jgi:hypothetical protein
MEITICLTNMLLQVKMQHNLVNHINAIQPIIITAPARNTIKIMD